MEFATELGKTTLFKDLDPKTLEKLASITKERQVRAGVELFREGQEVDELLVIVMGTVQVLKAHKGGGKEEVATLGSGSYIGEVELPRDARVSAATVETTEQTQVLSIDRDALLRLCDEEEHVGYQVFRAIARGLARRLAVTTDDAANYRAVAVRHR